MTKDEARHVAAILTAWADGKMIQYRTPQDGWVDGESWDNTGNPGPSLLLFDSPKRYRIKPKPREWWIVVNRPDGKGTAYTVRQRGVQNVHVREVIE